jgi:protein TonB
MKQIFILIVLLIQYLNGFSQDTISRHYKNINKETKKDTDLEWPKYEPDNMQDCIDCIDTVYENSFVIVDENATFQGGDILSFRTYVEKNLIYPNEIKKTGIHGRVHVKFVVDTTGLIIGSKLIRGVHPAIDKEALRCIEMSPKWMPAKLKNKRVKQQFDIIVNFSLN